MLFRRNEMRNEMRIAWQWKIRFWPKWKTRLEELIAAKEDMVRSADGSRMHPERGPRSIVTTRRSTPIRKFLKKFRGLPSAAKRLSGPFLEFRMVMAIVGLQLFHGHSEPAGGLPHIDTGLHQPSRRRVAQRMPHHVIAEARVLQNSFPG